MEYIKEYLVHYYEIDKNQNLKPQSIINYFEDTAILNSTAVGISLDDYANTNRGFMLLNWDVNIFNLPKFNETIKIVTTPTTFKRFLANRIYKVYNLNNELIIDGKSVWVYTDILNRKPCQIPEDVYLKFDVDSDSYKNFDMLESVTPIKEGEIKKRIIIQNEDIDTNNHVNNVRYADWAVGSLEPMLLQNYKVSKMNINYKKELHLGDVTELITKINEKEGELITTHSFYLNGNENCNLKFVWKKI